jgi:dihydroxy-acid dehydratase
MYTANTMASAAEALGMTLPGSSSYPAEEQDKWDECTHVGCAMKKLLELDLKPRDIMTRASFENAMASIDHPIQSVNPDRLNMLAQVLTMILGGSTNAVLHLIAIAHSVGIELTLDDFQRVSNRVPFIADLKPSGKYVMEDVYKLGGIPSACLTFTVSGAVPPEPVCGQLSEVLAYLLKNNLIDGNPLTVTGKTLGENLDRWTQKYGELSETAQDVIRPLSQPLKETGHIRCVLTLSCPLYGLH